jgi:hypothetical protein
MTNDDSISRREAMHACLLEQVDADYTKQESDYAYNRGCKDCAEAVSVLPATQPALASEGVRKAAEAIANDDDWGPAWKDHEARVKRIAAIISRHVSPTAEQMRAAIKELIDVMEIQEQRETEAFHLHVSQFRPMWDEAKAKGRAALNTSTPQPES